jgi:filamentous hemagglutinin family protein
MKCSQKLYPLGLSFLLFPSAVSAQIIPDNTTSTRLIQNTLINRDRVDGGLIRGNNLFHSFQEFNINTGRSVYFTNPTDITNIFTRVTGNNPSNINGTLGVSGKANLLFMNPNGIVFGSGSSLDVKGSFLGITASAINFADGTQFSVSNPQSTSLLTVSVPVGLGFGSNSGSITVAGTGHRGTEKTGATSVFIPVYPSVKPQLQLQTGKTMGLVASGITFDGGTVSVPDGRVELASVGVNQTVPLALNDNGFKLDLAKIENFQDINLIKAAVDVSGNNGGNLQVHGRRISLTQGSEMFAHTLGINGVGQGINIRGSESVDVIGSKRNAPITTIMASVRPQASGKGGDITISTPNFRLADGAYLWAELYGKGETGNITFNTKNFEMSGVETSGSAGIVTALSMGLIGRNANGKGGSLNINSERVRILNGARMRADLGQGSSGQPGDINLRTQSLEIAGIVTEGRSFFNSWISTTIESNSAGQAGNINIEADKVKLTNAGTIRLDTLAAGRGGSLTIKANDVEIMGANDAINRSSRVSSRVDLGTITTRNNNAGYGGRITIDTQRLRISDGGQITLSNADSTLGSSGNLIVNAKESVEVIGDYLNNRTGEIFTSGMRADIGEVATGQGGSIEINTPLLRVLGGGQISVAVNERIDGVSRRNAGNRIDAGSINIQARNIEVLGKTPNKLTPSRITADANSAVLSTSDIVGSVNIKTDQLTVGNGGLISVSGQRLGKAGNLNIDANILRLDNGGSLRADTNVENQGNINIQSETMLLRRGSQITTNATEAATGGNISINTGTLTALENSDITANSQDSFGGNVTIQSRGIFGTKFREQLTSESDITATSELGVSFNGKVDIITPDIKQQNNLKSQSDAFANVDVVVASSCLANRNSQLGRFVVTGNGGIPYTPGSREMDYSLVQIRGVTNSSKTTPIEVQPTTTSSWKIGDPINEATELVRARDGRLLLQANNTNTKYLGSEQIKCD